MAYTAPRSLEESERVDEDIRRAAERGWADRMWYYLGNGARRNRCY